MPQFISTMEATRRLSIGKTKLYALLKEGRINAVHLGSRTLIPVSELERFAASLPVRSISGKEDV